LVRRIFYCDGLNRNRDKCTAVPVEYTNMPHIIMQKRPM